MIEIEHLLRHRYQRPPLSDDEHRETEILALVVTGIDDPSVRATATDLTVKNREIAEAVLLLSGGAPLDRTPRGNRRGLILLGGAIAALILIGLPSLFSPTDRNSELVPKGADDRLDVAAQRGEERFRLLPNHAIRAGDRLGFFYTAREPGYLALLSIDDAGVLSTLQASTRIDAGREISLRDGAIAGEGSGCEWIVAVFSDAPIPLGQIREAIAAAPRNRNGCRLSASISGARSVRVIPLTR